MSSLPKLLGILLLLQLCVGQGGTTNCFINGKEYECLRHQFYRNCMSFVCHCDGTWRSSNRYRSTCRDCLFSNAQVNAVTFDGAKYSLNRESTYVLAEEEGGVSYVYSKLIRCNGSPRFTCVDDVTFKPRVGPIIKIQNTQEILTIGSPYDAEVVINGHSQRITTTGRQMQVLKGPANQDHPVLAFYLNDCLHIIVVDRNDFLVKICQGSVTIFSVQTKWSDREVSGMCGSPDGGSANDDLRLRNGTVVVNPNGWGINYFVDPAFAHDWKI